jgi:hypothetical protein
MNSPGVNFYFSFLVPGSVFQVRGSAFKVHDSAQNLELGTWNWNSELGTGNLELGTWNWEPVLMAILRT